MNKVKDCYSCPADGNGVCLLGYTRNREYVNFKSVGHVEVYSPKTCCHKPRTQKEFLERLKEQ